jgi:filamentous hemagglutinin family protein
MVRYWMSLWLGVVGAIGFGCDGVLAQSVIVPDGTLGAERSVVTPLDATQGIPIDTITRGAERGQNLFHSFQEFNVNSGRSTYFIAPNPSIQNIFTRVTGSNPSNLLGTLGTRFITPDNQILPSSANLFLLNPNGIVFGEGVQLDLVGAFAATTASGVRFGNSGEFSTINPQSPSQVLTISPSAFFVNQFRPSDITVNRSILSFPSGPQATLLLLGGNVVFDQAIVVSSGGNGRLEIGSMKGEGSISLFQNQNELRLGVLEAENRSNVIFKNQSVVSLLDLIGTGSGLITIQGRDIFLLDGSSLSTGISQGVDSRGTNRGDIRFEASGAIKITNGSGINIANNGGIGELGSLSVSGKTIELLQGSNIASVSVGQGNSSNITLKAEESISLTEVSQDGIVNYIQTVIGSIGNLSGVGNSGTITIQTPKLIVKDRSLISTVNLRASGNAGRIDILVNSAEVEESLISANTFGIGNAGDIVITAADRVSLNGDFTGITSNVGLSAIGKGGTLKITTNKLDVMGGAGITANSFGNGDSGNILISAGDRVKIYGSSSDELISSQISSNIQAKGSGQGGDIRISTGSLKLSQSGKITTGVFGTGNSGNIVIEALDSILIEGSNSLIASSIQKGAVGNGGNIRISTGSLNLSQGAQLISDTSGRGNAGNVVVDARDAVTLDGFSPDGQVSSAIYSSVQQTGVGQGGEIKITADRVHLSNGAILSSSTAGQGDSGNISLESRDALVIDQSQILGVVEFGAIGNGSQIFVKSGSFEMKQSEINTTAIGTGNAGDIRLEIDGDASVFKSLITSNVGNPQGDPTMGNVGNIALTATSISMSGSSQLQAGFYTNSAGKPGLISVQATDSIIFSDKDTGIFTDTEQGVFGNGSDIRVVANSVTMKDGAVLTARSAGNGKAGNILVQGRNFVILKDANISTNSLKDTGGDLKIVSPSIRLLGDSDLVTTVNVGNGQGGNITLNANSVIAFNDSDILTFALEGKGGNVTLNTRAFFGQNYRPANPGTNPQTLDGNDRVDINASGSLSSGTITTPDTSFIQNSLNQLPKETIDTTKLLANTCIVRKDKPEGTFYITGTGGLPNRPGDPAPSNYPTNTIAPTQTANRPWQKGDPIEEPQGFYQLANGRLVMSRECSSEPIANP